jgi:hypothetical protein
MAQACRDAAILDTPARALYVRCQNAREGAFCVQAFSPFSIGQPNAESAIMSNATTQEPKFRLRPWIYIIVAVVLVLYMVASYNKNATLNDLRRRCVDTFENTPRCECMTDEIGKRTYTFYYLPILRRFTLPSQHKLETILKQAAMACVTHQ